MSKNTVGTDRDVLQYYPIQIYFYIEIFFNFYLVFLSTVTTYLELQLKSTDFLHFWSNIENFFTIFLSLKRACICAYDQDGITLVWYIQVFSLQ